MLHREHERIFRRTWQYVGHTGQLEQPGDFVATRLADLPVVVVRGRDDVIRGFVNVCRHRGAEIVAGCGRRETLQCPYHAWTYDLDGTLRAAPRSGREPGFEREALSLVPVAVDTWGPFVFANADVGGDPLAAALGDLPEVVAASGLDVDAITFRLRAESSMEANWKVVCENFLECYHCQIAHPSFSDVIDVGADAYELDPGAGLYSTQLGPLRENGARPYDPIGEVRRGQFHFLWPNVTINIAPGRPNISIGPVMPAGTSGTSRFLDYFFAPDVDDDWVRDFLAFDDQVGVEDRALVESVQRGVATGAIDRGRLMTTSEALIARFQELTAAALD